MKHSTLIKKALPLALASALSMPVYAIEYTNGDFSVNIQSTLSYGVSSRVESRSDDLVGKCNLTPCSPVPLAALPNATQRAARGRFSVNGDDGNLNYDRGDVFSNNVKLTSELQWSWGENFGGLIRGTTFYDFENEDRDDLTDIAKEYVGKDTQLLDAFAYYNFTLGNGDGSFRFGRQVVSWGESTFIQGGINVINPFDVAKLRSAGAELKEAFLPIDMLHLSYSFNENISIEGLYMLEFEQTEPEPRGTYFSTNDFGTLGSEFVMLNFGLVDEPSNFAACFTDPRLAPTPSCQAAVLRLPDRFADDRGQYGAALRYFAPDLNNTEFGFFYLNYHSRVPLASGIAVTTSSANSARYFLEYPEDIKLYGMSFNTTLEGSGVAIQGELSYRSNQPYQIDDVELLFAALSPLNVLIPQPANRFYSQFGTLRPGQTLQGWERHEVSQLQFTLTKVFGPDNPIAADQIAAVAEFGGTRVWDLPDQSVLRYNGDGTDTGGGPDALTGNLRNPQTEANGFATPFSWGYRVALRADYNNFLGSAFTVSPRIAFNHDVNGTSPGPGGNFIEDRRSTTIGVEAVYLNQWSLDGSYTRFTGAGRYNLVSDRDFVSVAVKYAF
jgi:hypothetical protein